MTKWDGVGTTDEILMGYEANRRRTSLELKLNLAKTQVEVSFKNSHLPQIDEKPTGL